MVLANILVCLLVSKIKNTNVSSSARKKYSISRSEQPQMYTLVVLDMAMEITIKKFVIAMWEGTTRGEVKAVCLIMLIIRNLCAADIAGYYRRA